MLPFFSLFENSNLLLSPQDQPFKVCFLFCFLIQSDAICHRIFIKFTHILPFFSDDSLMKKENFLAKLCSNGNLKKFLLFTLFQSSRFCPKNLDFWPWKTIKNQKITQCSRRDQNVQKVKRKSYFQFQKYFSITYLGSLPITW